MTGNFTGARIKNPNKLLTQTMSFFFVPCITRYNIILYFRKKTENICHFRLSILA